MESRNSSLVVKQGNVIVKVHGPETDDAQLATRLRLITSTSLRPLFVQPLCERPERRGESLVTSWSAGIPSTAATPDEVDWEGAGSLLAALHQAKSTTRTPAGWMARLERSHRRLLAAKDHRVKGLILAAHATLPPHGAEAWNGDHQSLVHGDWHPGQVVTYEGAPRFVDVDDLGFGNPAWDLARPAGWRLAGLLSDSAWQRFLQSYLAAGGTATTPSDPWASLELPARAAVVQEAAKGLAHAERAGRPLEDYEQGLVAACVRIVKHSH